MAKEFQCTHHAVEQFISRWEPDLSYYEAKDELLRLLSGSKLTGKNHQGTEIYVSGERPEVRMLVKDRNICITVLPKDTNAETRELEKELAQEEAEYNKHRKNGRVRELKESLDAANKELVAINEERKKLGERKSELLIEIDKMNKELAAATYFDVGEKE